MYSEEQKQKVKAFAQDILKQCQDKGLTVTEVKLLPELLSQATIENNNRNWDKESFAYNPPIQ